ncbi:MAG: hypothetical protein ACFFBP_06440 [Promethearchaeota archaeon]
MRKIEPKEIFFPIRKIVCKELKKINIVSEIYLQLNHLIKKYWNS